MKASRNLMLSGVLSLAAAPVFSDGTWQNPGLAPNNRSNMHNDSYQSDNYTVPGPNAAVGAEVKLVTNGVSVNPVTHSKKIVPFGECLTHTFDAAGNLYSVCYGYPVPGQQGKKQLMAFDPEMHLLATKELPSASASLTNAGGGGYFYLDDLDRPVVVQGDGHLVVYQPLLGSPSGTGTFVAARDVNLNRFLPKGDELYSAMPDKSGNIWWVSSQGIVGYIDPDDSVQVFDLNDPEGDGVRVASDAWNYQEIANSIAVDEGDGAHEGSGVYVVSTHKLYRFGRRAGSIVIDWSERYDRGKEQKPGQISQGSGTTPTVFTLGDRRYVTIADNATPMNVNIYRAETDVGQEPRLFSQVQPFATNKSADENSIIAYPTQSGVALFVENNWGYTGPKSVTGRKITAPGFARIDVTPAGAVLGDVNKKISIPSVVSKGNSHSGVVYVYEKRIDGYWYLTGLAPDDLNKSLFSVQIGGASDNFVYNNHYAPLSLAPDGTLYTGSLFGVIQMRLY